MDRSPVSTAGVPGLGLAVVLGGQVPVKVLVRVQHLTRLFFWVLFRKPQRMFW